MYQVCYFSPAVRRLQVVTTPNRLAALQLRFALASLGCIVRVFLKSSDSITLL